MIKSTKLHWLVEAIVAGNQHIYMRFAYPPLFNLDPTKWYSPARWLFPEISAERASFSNILEQYTRERLTMTKESKTKRNDIMSALLSARDPKTNQRLSKGEVWTEAHLMMAAGGDTTSTVFAAVLFYLSRNSEAYTRLADEVRTTFSNAESIRRGSSLRSCTYLRACLDEALRLAPAAPRTLWREACSDGAVVDGVYIPAGFDAGVSTHALSHNEEYFSDPFKFDPLRFLKQTMDVCVESPFDSDSGAEHKPKDATSISSQSSQAQSHDTDASAPFSIGPKACLVKPLAYLELSLALARMIFLMDFEVVGTLGEGAPGMGHRRERREEFQFVDMFSSNKQGPMFEVQSQAMSITEWYINTGRQL